MDRCCCGRIEDFSEPVIINDRLHERLGDPGSFCGPVDAHTARDQQQEIEQLKAALNLLKGIEVEAMDSAHDYTEAEKEIEQLRSLLQEALPHVEQMANELATGPVAGPVEHLVTAMEEAILVGSDPEAQEEG